MKSPSQYISGRALIDVGLYLNRYRIQSTIGHQQRVMERGGGSLVTPVGQAHGQAIATDQVGDRHLAGKEGGYTVSRYKFPYSSDYP